MMSRWHCFTIFFCFTLFAGSAGSLDAVAQTEQEDVTTRGNLPQTQPLTQSPIPNLSLGGKTPATCPTGYTVNGQFVSKAAFQATQSPSKSSSSSPTSPIAPAPLPSIPSPNLALPAIRLPLITGVAWNFDSKLLEIRGNDFSEGYLPNDTASLTQTIPQLIVNNAVVQSRSPGGFFINAPSIQQSGCYTFVVQRRVPKQEVVQGRVVYTQVLGPQSLPYQEFVFVPNPPVINSVRSLPVSNDQPLGYEIIGQDLGKQVTQLQITAAAAANQRLADGSVATRITANQIQVIDDHTIRIRNEIVQGETKHLVTAPDPHYGTVQSNVVTAVLPKRLVLTNGVSIPGGYILEGPEASLGSDVNQLRLIENNNSVPQSQLSLQVVTGVSTNTVRIQVNNPAISGTISHRVSSIAPGAGGISRALTITHNPTPTISTIQLTNYGFDLLGVNFGNNPSSTYMSFVAGTTGIIIPSQGFSTAFFREVSNTKIAVNYGTACQTLPLVRTAPNQVSVTSGYGTVSARTSQPLSFTFPASWPQYTPSIVSAIRTPDGIEINGTNLGDMTEVCRLSVLVSDTNSARMVAGSSTPNDFLTVNNTVLRIRLNPAPTGPATVSVIRSGMASQAVSINPGQ
jgi:hypothetical protein